MNDDLFGPQKKRVHQQALPRRWRQRLLLVETLPVLCARVLQKRQQLKRIGMIGMIKYQINRGGQSTNLSRLVHHLVELVGRACIFLKNNGSCRFVHGDDTAALTGPAYSGAEKTNSKLACTGLQGAVLSSTETTNCPSISLTCCVIGEARAFAFASRNHELAHDFGCPRREVAALASPNSATMVYQCGFFPNQCTRANSQKKTYISEFLFLLKLAGKS